MLAVGLGLASSVAWGISDFLAGIRSRRLPLLTVLFASQLAGLIAIVAIVVGRGEGAPGGDFALFAALSSLAGLVGLGSFYRGLAIGAMGVVAPVSATAAIIPVVFGIASGDRPTLVQGAGVALAVAGVALASREASDEARAHGQLATGVGLALISAVGFGLFFVTIDLASDADVYWVLLVNRITGVSLLTAAVLIARPALGMSGADGRVLVLVGLLDMAANAMFAVASTKGLVSVVAVLASLYPVTTILLARLVLRERLHALQRAGAVGALAGVALISAG